jgi:hypothetical protein
LTQLGQQDSSTIFALVERNIDKYYKTASSLDDGACMEGLLRRGLYKAE